MSIFDRFIVRQADIYSYSVTVTVTAEGFFLAKKLQNDDDAYKLRRQTNH